MKIAVQTKNMNMCLKSCVLKITVRLMGTCFASVHAIAHTDLGFRNTTWMLRELVSAGGDNAFPLFLKSMHMGNPVRTLPAKNK